MLLCIESTPRQVEDADVVLRGTVESRDVYKGTAGATALIHSQADGSARGLEVAVGREYVVFAHRVDGELRANLCGGTAPAGPQLVAEIESATGEVHPPDPSAAEPIQADGERTALALARGSLVVVALAALYVVRRLRP